MSKDIRQMIDKVKNFNQFINENYSNFDDVFNTIKIYIDFTLGSDKKINEYVPNTHIAEVFKEVLNACEKESMYPEVYHNLQDKDVKRISFLDKIDEYFNLELLEKNGEEEVHRVYQKLREKHDYIRNMLKLIDIRIPDEYNMRHKVKNDLKSDKIIISKSFN